MVTAKWVKENYSTAPSPYIHTFSGTSTTIPYNKIRGLKWVKFQLYNVYLSTRISHYYSKIEKCYINNTSIGIFRQCLFYFTDLTYFYFPFTDMENKKVTACREVLLSSNGCNLNSHVFLSYNRSSGAFSWSADDVTSVHIINYIYFSKDGKD